MFRDRGKIQEGSQEDREEMEGRKMETQRNTEKQGRERGVGQPGLQTQGHRSAPARPRPLLCLWASITGGHLSWGLDLPRSLPGQAAFPGQL